MDSELLLRHAHGASEPMLLAYFLRYHSGDCLAGLSAKNYDRARSLIRKQNGKC